MRETFASALGLCIFVACMASVADPCPASAQEEGATPSVAEAARLARERHKSTTPSRVLTNEDLSFQNAETGELLSDQQVRAILEKEVPRPLTADVMDRLRITFGYNRAEIMPDSYMIRALGDYSQVLFPGRDEWVAKYHDALDHLADEVTKLHGAIDSIESTNRSVIEAGNGLNGASERLEQVRQQLIEALIPETRWSRRAQEMVEDAKARAKAYLANSRGATGEYRKERAPAAEEAVGSALIWLGREEEKYREAYGHYTCDLQDFKFGDSRGPHSAGLLFANITAYQAYDYKLTIQGCDLSQGRHFRALAVAPSTDGTQGRSFCSDDTGDVRIAGDEQIASCFSRGAAWKPTSWTPSLSQ